MNAKSALSSVAEVKFVANKCNLTNETLEWNRCNAGREGFEPSTSSLEGWRSIRAELTSQSNSKYKTKLIKLDSSKSLIAKSRFGLCVLLLPSFSKQVFAL